MKISEGTLGSRGSSPRGAIGIDGAEIVRAEFQQAEGAVPYFLIVDPGRRSNILREAALAAYLLLVLLAYLLARSVFLQALAALSALLILLLAVVYSRIFRHLKDNLAKEKVFLTDRFLIVQHSLQERAVRYIPLERLKKFSYSRTPFGEFSTAVYLDGEGIGEMREKLYFPADLKRLESEAMLAAEGLRNK